MSRFALMPASALPLAYFAFAHAGLAIAFLLLAVDPNLPGGYFLHPRMVALVHLVTLAWISGTILGALYIVAPLALGIPLAGGRVDWIAWAAFVLGATGMATHFWIGEYRGMVWSAGLVLGAIGWLGWRVARGLPAAPAPFAVKLHVALAFANVAAAAGIGMWLGTGRPGAPENLSPASAAFAHAHVAAVGWALMLVVGLGYRLLPMILPAKPPDARGLSRSAVLIETGLVLLVVGLFGASRVLPVGAVAIAAGMASFATTVRRMASERLPRPPALPPRDWSAWQVHGAMLWLLAAMGLGVTLSVVPAGVTQIRLAWIYGVAGLVGGIGQVIVGMQGRLVPMYAYYRAMAALGGAPPERSAHALVSAPFARALFLLWTPGVPLLAFGLAHSAPLAVRIGSMFLAAGVITGWWYIVRLMREAKRGAAKNGGADL